LEEHNKGTAQQKRAAELAKAHDGTPSISHLDALARAFLAVADNRPRGVYESRSELDLKGNILSIRDAKGRIVARYDHDLARRRLHEWLADSGDRWRLPDITDQPVRQWDARDFVQRHVYDELRRPTHLFVSNTSSRAAPFGSADIATETRQVRQRSGWGR